MKIFTTVFRIKLFLLLLLSFVFINRSSAQGKDSKGKDFWLMFNGNLGVPTLTLFITSDVNTTGTVAIPGLAFSLPFTVAANTVTPVVIPADAATHTNDVVDNKGIHVTAAAEVTVYGLNYIPFTTDAYLGLPTDVLGTDYIVLTYRNSNVVNAVEFGIVGTVNSTTVTITPSVTTLGHTAGVPYNVTLNQGQTYELVNESAAPADLTGTIITSTQPVGVMGAFRCANIPGGYTYCDHIVEMLPPTTTWGKKFGTVPLKSRSNGDTWRFMASENGTVVTINGAAEPAINRGQFVEKILTSQSVVESNKPILVAQYSNGSSFSGNPGDPFMMLIPPLEQFLAKYTVTTVSGYVAHFINLIAPNAVVGTLQLDGAAVPPAQFTPIGSTGFSGAQLSVPEGTHNLSASLPFGVFQYGFNNDDSYGYPGGQSFSEVAIVTKVFLDLVPGTSAQVGSQNCLKAKASDQNGNPVEGVRIDFNITGANTVTGFGFTNAAGVATFCYTGTKAGTDNIVASVGTVTATGTFLWTDCNLTLTARQINVSCYKGSNGSIDLTVTNGKAAIKYEWSNGATTEDISGLPAGSYTVKVTDANNCKGTATFTITQPQSALAGGVITMTPGTTVPGQQPNTIYPGYGPQQVVLTAAAVTGGVPPYTYSWSPLASLSNIVNGKATATPLVTTTYTLTIKDANNCIITRTFTVNVALTRCGNKGDKIIICHKGTESCIAPEAVPAHLAHGDILGSCIKGAAREAANLPVEIVAEIEKRVGVFPNPSKGSFIVQLDRPQGVAEVIILNSKGSLIEKRKASALSAQTVFNLPNLSPGMYMVKVVTADGVQTIKVLIAK